MNEEREFSFKIVVVGNSEVGKTSLIVRYTKGFFNQEYIMTLGTQISKFQEIVEGNSIKLVFWDLAGQATFDKLRKNFYHGARAAIIVFSHEENDKGENSFKNIVKWLKDVKEFCEDVPIILFGNKIDLIDKQRLINNEELPKSDYNIGKLAKALGFYGYFKTSALTGEGVQEAFKAIINEIVRID